LPAHRWPTCDDERVTSRAAPVWYALAACALVISLSLPLAAGTTTTTRVVLALMHAAVAAVLVATLRPRAAAPLHATGATSR